MGSLILDIGLGDVSNEAMLIGQTVVKHIGRLGLDTPIEEYASFRILLMCFIEIPQVL